jgi:NAD(P)-dependent dehydrogenase (short-subunit alcohol dehydrogenase family)
VTTRATTKAAINEPRLAAQTKAHATLVEELVAMTGYPPELFDLDADLRRHLSIAPDETSKLIERVQRRLRIARRSPTERVCTLRDVLAFLESVAVESRDSREPAVARRSILEMVNAPASGASSKSFRPQGGVLIVGDNAVADALRQELGADASVVQLRPAEGIDAALAAIEKLPVDSPVRHVFLLTALDADSDGLLDASSWNTRRAQGLELPLLVLQKWRQRLTAEQLAGPTTIVAATRLGGDFGANGSVVSPEGGWLAGALKALDVEFGRRKQPTVIKVCDFAAADGSQFIAATICRELAEQGSGIETGFVGGRRQTLRVVEQRIDMLPRRPIERGTSWVITGGARGVTAEVALALGVKYGLKLHLIGSRSAPASDAPCRHCSPDELADLKRSTVREAVRQRKSPEEQWSRVKNDVEVANNLDRMRSAGIDVDYHACDVSDRELLEKTLAEIRRLSGPIVGVVHGAGYGKPGRLELLKRESLAKTIDAKVAGAVNLMSLTRDDPLWYFVGFGSISGRYGGNGLSDYAAANEMLAKLCTWHRGVRPDCATTCIAWPSWGEVGLALRSDSAVGLTSVLKTKLMPVAEGVEHFMSELEAGLPRGEVLIDDGSFAPHGSVEASS